MAAIVRHGIFKTRPVFVQNHVGSCWRSYATKAEKKKGIDRKQPPKIEWTAQSIASKGFLRPQKEYIPPDDVEAKLEAIVKSNLASTENSASLGDIKGKFKILTQCSETFHHKVPNSLLHSIRTVGDLKQFYLTLVDVTTPLDKLQNMNLPKNLHVQYEYVRFHPDTDTKFNGVTAFPKSSTLVTGLKYKDKYKGHTQAQQWPYK